MDNIIGTEREKELRAAYWNVRNGLFGFDRQMAADKLLAALPALLDEAARYKAERDALAARVRAVEALRHMDATP